MNGREKGDVGEGLGDAAGVWNNNALASEYPPRWSIDETWIEA